MQRDHAIASQADIPKQPRKVGRNSDTACRTRPDQKKDWQVGDAWRTVNTTDEPPAPKIQFRKFMTRIPSAVT